MIAGTQLHPCITPILSKSPMRHGLTGIRVTSRAEVEAAVCKAEETEGSVVIDFRVEKEEFGLPHGCRPAPPYII